MFGLTFFVEYVRGFLFPVAPIADAVSGEVCTWALQLFRVGAGVLVDACARRGLAFVASYKAKRESFANSSGALAGFRGMILKYQNGNKSYYNDATFERPNQHPESKLRVTHVLYQV